MSNYAQVSQPLEAGFKRLDMVAVWFCTADQIHNPVNWPGVISSRPGSNFWWKDGEPYDPETADMTALELAEARFEFEDDADERQQMEAMDLLYNRPNE